ncbi:VPLPA-CTERM sorting domain-containing protein [Frigidibacter sp. MR17.24]|uniref:VPLPA-CTERM sorting domain-containing protein n=1 Tax=Frigidibacter sp. MR17.24 TaxID=3127345 RepID=UPI003012B40C
MKSLLLSAAPVAILLAAAPGSAATLCMTAGAATTCTGTGAPAAGFTLATTPADRSVTVTAGASVSGTGRDAIRARGTGTTITNLGTLVSDDSDGIDGGTGLTVINAGTIAGGNRGIDADDLDGLTVVNTGTITGVDRAIRNGAGTGADITNSGTMISTTDEGVETGDDARVVNTGRIQGADDALQVGRNAYVLNAGVLENVWTGAGEPQDALDIDQGTVINTGSIVAAGSAGIDFDANVADDDAPETTPHAASAVYNAGLIQGVEAAIESDPRSMGVQAIVNSGALVGTAGTALMLWGGDDSLVMQEGATIVGASFFGTGNDLLSLDASFAGATFGLFDGGADDDTVSFARYAIDDIAGLVLAGGVFSLTFSDAFSLSLTNWDSFVFAGTSYDRAAMAARATLAPVPLPAAGWAMLAGLGGLAALRRRRAA